MSKSNSFSSSDDILEETLDAGDDVTINVDLDGSKTWYFQAVDEGRRQAFERACDLLERDRQERDPDLLEQQEAVARQRLVGAVTPR